MPYYKKNDQNYKMQKVKINKKKKKWKSTSLFIEGIDIDTQKFSCLFNEEKKKSSVKAF